MKKQTDIQIKIISLLQQKNMFAGDLCKELNVSQLSLRCHIKKMRRQGVPITSGPGGYGYVKSVKEMEGTLHHLKSRALSELTTYKKIVNNFCSPNSQDSLFNEANLLMDEIIKEIKEL
jgi:biotin operon repressor